MATHAEAEKAVAAGQKLVDAAHQQYLTQTKGKPTPTQKECDMIKAGAALVEKEADGAAPEPRYITRAMEAARAGVQATATTRVGRPPGGSAGSAAS